MAPQPECEGNGDALAGPSLVCVEGGSFTLGDDSFSTPPRTNVVVSSFWIDSSEVTVGHFRECVELAACTRPDTGGDCNFSTDREDREQHPVNCVDHAQARDFCYWAAKRLPTEEEWEFAARGPGASPRTFPWGEADPLDRVCWQRSDGTCPVGSFPAGDTPLGISDMAGNVRELTSTCDDPNEVPCFLAAPGGSWVSDTEFTLLAGNPWNGVREDRRTRVTGFRCAR
jgi:formylglycine-generating enzyme required for sulfatase activity